ncbi:MAG: FtsX-like permease family protein [Planctomycetia bacterium]|nr:FtsX-like permease family protein [Planctomycetia bacterium]
MYKLLLTWRYLLTRYIALVSVISVTLGVATMIIVNAVMLGFSREMETRIHGVLSDVTISSRSSLRGFDDVDARVKDALNVAGDMIEAITPTVTTPGLLSFEVLGGEVITRQVQIIGISGITHEKVTSISQFLQHPENRKHLSFLLREDHYDTFNPEIGETAIRRPALEEGGWIHRRLVARREKAWEAERQRQKEIVRNLPTPQSDHDPLVASPNPVPPPPLAAPGSLPAANSKKQESRSSKAGTPDPYKEVLKNLPAKPSFNTDVNSDPDSPNAVPTPVLDSPLDDYEQFQVKFDKETQQETGAIVAVGIVSGLRRKIKDPETGKSYFQERLTRVPGDDITLSFLAVGAENSLPRIVYDRFTITDLYECRMTEYDETFVFVPIERLQELRNMIAPNGTRLATHLLIKAKPGIRIEKLRDKLQESKEFPPALFEVETWRDQQAMMLAAVSTELSILNVLLFLIIAVAGFGILAIFFMIVVEKTRDIGILKSLGASSLGIMQIYLGYGLALGIVGSGLGLILGLEFVHHINDIAAFLSKIMGHEVFDPAIYMFHEVPAIVEPYTVFWIMLGAIFIAVLSGILPALRAARLNPVDALRV